MHDAEAAFRRIEDRSLSLLFCVEFAIANHRGPQTPKKLADAVADYVTAKEHEHAQDQIPAGAEVHGRASLDRARERIAVSGKWIVIWRDTAPLNGTEPVISGIALDRAKDDTTGEFGLRDGFAGLLGDLVKSDDWQEIKLFASTFLAGAATGLQQLQNQGTAFGTTQVPLASGRNAALQGTADVLTGSAERTKTCRRSSC